MMRFSAIAIFVAFAGGIAARGDDGHMQEVRWRPRFVQRRQCVDHQPAPPASSSLTPGPSPLAPVLLGVAILPGEGESETGLEVVAVDRDSPAERVGLQVGDRILAVDAKFVGSYSALVTQLRHCADVGYGDAFLLWRRGDVPIARLTERLGVRGQGPGVRDEETKKEEPPPAPPAKSQRQLAPDPPPPPPAILFPGPDIVRQEASPKAAIGSTIAREADPVSPAPARAAAIATGGEHASAMPRDDFSTPASLLILGVTAIAVIRRCRSSYL